MNKQMSMDIKWLENSLFTKEYYRDNFTKAVNTITKMTGTIVDLEYQLVERGNAQVELIEYKNYNKLAHEKIADLERQLRAAWQLEADAALNNLTEMSQLDNTGNNNNESI